MRLVFFWAQHSTKCSYTLDACQNKSGAGAGAGARVVYILPVCIEAVSLALI